MADTTQLASGDQDQGDVELDPAGRVQWLDWAGGAAAVLLIVIVADIFSDGRLISAPLRRWAARRKGGTGEQVPAAGPGGD